jgi:2-hydroxychromene-2-carboxylate isomerase
MRMATHAGDGFARDAVRAAFADGVDLALEENVLAIAGDRADGYDEAATKAALRAATDAAHALGVHGVPTIAVGDELYWGDDRLEDAARRARLVSPR